LIVVFAKGGWDVSYTFDSKQHVADFEGPEVDQTRYDDDVEEVSTFGAIPLLTNPYRRPWVTTFFDKWHDQLALLNGMVVGAIGHDHARTRLLTGTDEFHKPDLTVIAGHILGAERPMPAFDLSGLQYAGELASSTGRLGPSGQIPALMAKDLFFAAPEESGLVYPLRRFDLHDDEAAIEYLKARTDRFRTRFDDGAHNSGRLDDLLVSNDRALLFGSQTEGLDLSVGNSVVDTFLLASELLDGGVCQTVLMDDHADWDTHYDTHTQHERFDLLFEGLDALAADLVARDLYDRTLVCVLSEMTRSPRRNAFFGKDHWPHSSALFFGGPVVGGRVRGGTNDLLESLPVDLETGALDDAGSLLMYDQLVAGLLEMMGVDPGEWLPGVRPYRGLLV
jgi:hypothetical protein